MQNGGGITNEIKAKAREMHDELESASFEVVLVPAREQRHSNHYVRVCQSGNPKWYRDLCAAHTSCRGIGRRRHKRPRTFIKKDTTLNALNNLSKGLAKGVYAERLLFIIGRELERESSKGKAATAGSLIVNGKVYF